MWKIIKNSQCFRLLKAPTLTKNAHSLEMSAFVDVYWLELFRVWKWNEQLSFDVITFISSKNTKDTRNDTRTWLLTCHHVSGKFDWFWFTCWDIKGYIILSALNKVETCATKYKYIYLSNRIQLVLCSLASDIWGGILKETIKFCLKF